jgi:prolyl-tRNA synthetase
MTTRQSQLFGKTRKDISADEVSTNAKLLMRAGFIEKNMAGIYTLLPLGFRVFKKIEQIIREEMDALGAQELLMPVFQDKEVWSQTGRWQDKVGGVMYQFKDSSGKELGLGPTHEEVIVDLVKKQVKSYKDLPMYVYQIQNKFRDEPRAKSGMLRTREFFMKDLYSFTHSAEETAEFYQKAHDSYLKIFKRLGLVAFSVEASGGSMSKKFSHEFMVVTPAGEDTTIYCSKCGWAQNTEIAQLKAGDPCPTCSTKLELATTVEAGNIFDQETLYTEKMGAFFTDQDGKQKPIYMGAYGIGLGRALGTIVEASHDDKGIIWTPATTPYHAHILLISDKAEVKAAAQALAQELSQGYDVLFDDRDVSAGQKFADADLIGIPVQIIFGDKQSPKIECKLRKTGATEIIDSRDISKLMTDTYAEGVLR